MDLVGNTNKATKRAPEAVFHNSPKKVNFNGITPLKNFKDVETPTDRPFRVSIEGNIGAGKSTLIKYFENMPGIETYPVCDHVFFYFRFVSILFL